MKRRTPVILAVLLVALAAIGVTALSASGASSSGAATVKTRHVKLGTILVDSKGHTLYLFEKDKHGKSACSGACAKAWPPVITKGKPKAAGGTHASMLGTTKRSDGTTQVTYNHHPLYTFIKDAGKPGSTKGQGVDAFGAEWYVVGTNGKKIEKGES